MSKDNFVNACKCLENVIFSPKKVEICEADVEYCKRLNLGCSDENG
jgi:hypothetical protein